MREYASLLANRKEQITVQRSLKHSAPSLLRPRTKKMRSAA